MDIHFSSSIRADYRDSLERVFYFNKNQSRYYQAIMRLIDQYGEPRIVQEDANITMCVGDQIESRCLFASVGPKIIGVIIYGFDPPEQYRVLHLAVDEDYTMKGPNQEQNLVEMLIEEVKKRIRTENIIQSLEYR